MSDRGKNGQFKKGNPGGPGRPRRMIEADYLASLSEHVPKDAWAEIVGEAVARAREGDAKARDWLSRYLLPGNKGSHLLELAAREAAGGGVADQIAQVAIAMADQPLPPLMDRAATPKEESRRSQSEGETPPP